MSAVTTAPDHTNNTTDTYTTRLGHAHIKVRDLSRAAAFYTRLFHLKVIEQVGEHYLFLSGDNRHHEIALQALGPDAPIPPAFSTGLYHIAFEVADKRQFAAFYETLLADNIERIAVDHGISWAVYFDDPDGNGLELYVDTRHERTGADQWTGTSRRLMDAEILAHLL